MNRKNCLFDESLLTAFLDNQATETEKELVNQHLPTCPDCSAFVDTHLQLKAAVRQTAETSKPEANPYLYGEIVNKLQKKSVSKLQQRKLQIAFATVVFLLIGFGSIYSIMVSSSTTDQKLASNRVPSTSHANVQHLLDPMTGSDMLIYLVKNSVPLTVQRTSYLTIHQPMGQSAELVFSSLGGPMVDWLQILSNAQILPDDQLKEVDHVVKLYANWVRDGIRFNTHGDVLINPELVNYRKQMMVMLDRKSVV